MRREVKGLSKLLLLLLLLLLLSLLLLLLMGLVLLLFLLGSDILIIWKIFKLAQILSF